MTNGRCVKIQRVQHEARQITAIRLGELARRLNSVDWVVSAATHCQLGVEKCISQ